MTCLVCLLYFLTTILVSKFLEMNTNDPKKKVLDTHTSDHFTGCFLGPDIKRFCLTFWYQIFFYYVNRVNLHKTESAIKLIL